MTPAERFTIVGYRLERAEESLQAATFIQQIHEYILQQRELSESQASPDGDESTTSAQKE